MSRTATRVVRAKQCVASSEQYVRPGARASGQSRGRGAGRRAAVQRCSGARVQRLQTSAMTSTVQSCSRKSTCRMGEGEGEGWGGGEAEAEAKAESQGDVAGLGSMAWELGGALAAVWAGSIGLRLRSP